MYAGGTHHTVDDGRFQNALYREYKKTSKKSVYVGELEDQRRWGRSAENQTGRYPMLDARSTLASKLIRLTSTYAMYVFLIEYNLYDQIEGRTEVVGRSVER